MSETQNGALTKLSEAAQDLLGLSVGSLPKSEELRQEIAEAFAAEN